MSLGVRVLAAGSLIALYALYPTAGVGALATVFGYVLAQRTRGGQKAQNLPEV